MTLVGGAIALGAPDLVAVVLGSAPIPSPLFNAGLGLVFNGFALAVAHRVCARHGTGDMRSDLRLRFARSDVGLGFLTALVALQFAAVVQHLLIGWFDVTVMASPLDSVPRRDLLPMAIGAVLFAPVAEEVLFRGLLQRSLASRFRPAPRIILQATVFAACHTVQTSWHDAVYLSGIFAVGVVFGVAVDRTARLGTTIVAHAIVNVLAFGQVFVG